MRNFFCLVIVVLFIASCSSTSTVGINSKTNGNALADGSSSTSVNSAISTVDQSNANAPILNNENAAIIHNTSISKDNMQIWQRKKNLSKVNTPIAESVTQFAVPAPDDSEVSSQMNSKGEPVETRVFKKNSLLAKVERINLDNANIKVYLKNGKVVNLPEGKIDNFLTSTADDILKAVGATR